MTVEGNSLVREKIWIVARICRWVGNCTEVDEVDTRLPRAAQTTGRGERQQRSGDAQCRRRLDKARLALTTPGSVKGGVWVTKDRPRGISIDWKEELSRSLMANLKLNQ